MTNSNDGNDQSEKVGFTFGPNDRNISIRNFPINDMDVGIRSNGASNLTVENVTFNNVQTPFDIKNPDNVAVSGSRIMNDPKMVANSKPRSGYSSKGAPLPSLCPKCDSVFPSRNYGIQSPAFYGFDNEESCPNCGYEHARLAGGLFNISEDLAEIIEADAITYAMFSRIASILAAAAFQVISEEEAERQIEAISPRMAKRVKGILGSQTLIGWLAFFVASLGVYLDHRKPPEMPPECVISQTITEKQSLARYVIRTTAEACFEQLKNKQLHLRSERMGKNEDVDAKKQPVKKRTASQTPSASEKQQEDSGDKIQLPLRGPMPPPRPVDETG